MYFMDHCILFLKYEIIYYQITLHLTHIWPTRQQTCVRHHKQQQVVDRLFVIIAPYQRENKKNSSKFKKYQIQMIRAFHKTLWPHKLNNANNMQRWWRHFCVVSKYFYQCMNLFANRQFCEPMRHEPSFIYSIAIKSARTWKSEIFSIKWWRLKSVNLTL